MDLLIRGATDIDTGDARPFLVTDPHSTPCRRCLIDVEPGEEALLVSYDPFGGEVDALLVRLLARPDAAFVHVHNARPGCFAVRVERAGAPRIS